MLKHENRRDWMKSTVVHSLKGRLRLTVNGLEFLKKDLSELAKSLASLRGVRSARVTVTTAGVLFLYDPAKTDSVTLQEQADVIFARYAMNALRERHTAEPEEAEQPMTVKRLATRLAINGTALAAGNTILKGTLLGGTAASFTSLTALAALGLSSPIAKNAWNGLKTDLRPNADFLTVTSIVASLMLGMPNSALMILALSDMAELMTSFTIERTRSSIKQMLSVETSDVWKVLPDGTLNKCPIEELHKDDVVEIHTGEKIAVDGKILSGSAVIDQSAITGEFAPAEKRPGEEVFAGTIVKNGIMRVRALKVGDQTVVSRIVGMVEDSELKKAPIQRYADRFSNYLVPLNFLLCGAVYLVTHDARTALKMLVIDYSCGIKLSTATAFSAAINTAVRKGVLIKGGAYIEQMAAADTVLLDKTGTITEGKPRIIGSRIMSRDLEEKDLLALATAAEETSTHPLARAILEYGDELGVEMPAHGDIITEIARGSRTVVDGRTIRVGNLKYMEESGVLLPETLPPDNGSIMNFVAADDTLLGILYAMDRPRENVRRMINALRYDGVGDIEMLTGDTISQAKEVAEMIGADSFKGQLLPEQKVDAVLRQQSHGNTVVMVGDGINDAPALAYANVGISLGGKCTDIAIETSDVVINRDDPMMIHELRKLSEHTMQIVKQNFTMVIGINTVGLILGAASNISVTMSALMHNMSTILVVANSLRLMLTPGTER